MITMSYCIICLINSSKLKVSCLFAITNGLMFLFCYGFAQQNKNSNMIIRDKNLNIWIRNLKLEVNIDFIFL